VNLKDGQPIGCRNNGNCSTGGCNRLNTYDWISTLELEDIEPFNIVEVSFKNGSRKTFFYNQPFTRASTGDLVVVDTQVGYDVGRISLSGELVRLQMRKKRVPEDGYFPKVIRKANERDLEKLEEVRSQETPSMIRARAIARTLGLNMKIGDVEFQGDGKKATFYYTADGRVDFRELIRHFAKEFKVKIEMRQIGARQESARIGGIGPCGRELCCSTWLTTYRTVSTAAARYQNLAINQAKLSGQCGRLKCCLNYELDTYMEALSNFPEDAEKLRTKNGVAVMMKTDIFKGLMYYGYEHEHGRGRFYALDLQQVRSVREMNRRGELPEDLAVLQVVQDTIQSDDHGYGPDDLTGVIELPPDEKRRRKKKKKGKERDSREAGGGRQERKPAQQGPQKNAPKEQEARKAPEPKRQESPGQERPKPVDKAPELRRQEPPGQERPKAEGRDGAGKRRGRGGRNRRGRGKGGDNGKEV
jgi:cell fate regulator YaaT (PSP1 superfamily)